MLRAKASVAGPVRPASRLRPWLPRCARSIGVAAQLLGEVALERRRDRVAELAVPRTGDARPHDLLKTLTIGLGAPPAGRREPRASLVRAADCVLVHWINFVFRLRSAARLPATARASGASSIGRTERYR